MTAGTAPVTPAAATYTGGSTQVWELPATAPAANLLARAGNWPGATTFNTWQQSEAVTTNAQDLCIGRFVSDALVGAQTVSGTVNGQMLFSEGSNSANMLPQGMLKVVSSDGSTLRGVLWGGDSHTTAVDEVPLSVTNKKIPAAGISPVTLSSVDAQDGDYIVFEVGVRANNTSATSFTGRLRSGSTATAGGANDLTEGGTETTDLNPWIEFSQDLNFGGAAPASLVIPTDAVYRILSRR